MGKNLNQNKARKAKNDEFYTQLVDIENELKHYEKQFKNKTVLCNCDDPRQSNFFRYFTENFHKLKLKKLIITCFKSKQMSLFDSINPEKAIYLEYSGQKINDKIPTIDEIGYSYLKGDGDFRNRENIEILKKSDIIVTNPPFSLFREFIEQLMKYEKKFLMIGNLNAITYKETFQLIKNDKIWLGNHVGDIKFKLHYNHESKNNRPRKDKNIYNYRSFRNIRWFTNMQFKNMSEMLTLTKKFNELEYPKYDNYDAIEVSKVKDIPADYDGFMGVPITFLDKYDPEQFEIIGIDITLIKEKKGIKSRFIMNGNELYARIVIKHKRK